MEEERWKILILLIRQIAKEKKITHWDIAIKTGIDRAHITHIFNLKYIPRFDTFVKIAAAVGIIFSFKTDDGEKLDFARLRNEAKKNYK